MQNTFGRFVTYMGMVVGLLICLLHGTTVAASDVFFACARNNGSLLTATITLNTAPSCPGNTTLVSWFAEGPPPYVITASEQIDINETKLVMATCNPGDRVQTGGWQIQPVGGVGVDVLVSMDQAAVGPPFAPTSWAVRVKNISPNAVLLIVFANCFDLTP